MKKIKEILAIEIGTGKVNWEKLEPRIFAALEAVGGNFEVMHINGEKRKMKLDDAVTFKAKDGTCIKLFSPRFIQGHLWCSGIQHGFYGEDSKPILDPRSLVRF